MRQSLLPLALVLLSWSLGACGGSSPTRSGSPGMNRQLVSYGAPPADSDGSYARRESVDSSYEPSPVAMGMAPAAPAPAPQPPPLSPPTNTPPAGVLVAPATGPTPLLIYRANIHLAVFEASKSIDEVEALAKKLGGYLVERSDMGITVRIPAAKFDGALETIAKVGDELHRQVNVQDVTGEFRDLQVRLRNLEAVRERLAALLTRAMSVDDALKIERELERLSGDIESIKGKLKLFQELIAFSTITVNFQARPVETISSEVNLPFDWLNNLGLGPLLDLN